MAVNLTAGAISVLSTPGQTTDLKPVLQVMDIRTVPAGGARGDNTERYRVLLSDGEFHQQGMLATQRNELVRSQQLQKGSIVQLKEYVCNAIRERVIIIIIDLNVIVDTCDIIGDAKPFPPKSLGNDIPPMPRSAPPSVIDSRPPNETAAPVLRPHSNVGPTVHTPEPQHNTGSHSYNNSFNNIAQSGQYKSTPAPPNNRMHPPPMYGNRGPMAKNEAPPRIIPIVALNPYQGKWTIKARVTVKGDLRRYNNAKGDGKVFSFDLLDSDGGEIRATCFNAVADQFYNQIEVGKVYYISKGSVKPAQKAYNHLKNDYEITLDHTSTIQPCFDDDTSIPRQQFHFRSIGEIENMDNNTVLDVIGVVSSITPVATIMRKNGDETQKRTLYLKDMSGRSIELTLWGKFCNSEGQTLQEMSDSGIFPILAVKSARVYEFNGKSIGTISSSQLSIEPDFPEALKLKTWFENVGKNVPSVSVSRESVSRVDVFKTISQIKDEKLGTSEKPDWITINATIFHLKVDNFCYTACPIMVGERKCSKKVMKTDDDKWRCDKCDKVVDECDYRYILQLQIQDHTGLIWTTAFQETGEEVMGIPAKDLFSMRYEEQDEERFGEIINNARFNEYTFKLKVKEEVYGEEQKVKSTVVKAEKIKFSTNTKFLLSEIQKMHNTNSNSGFDSEVKSIPSVVNYGGQNGGPTTGGQNNSECNKCHKSGHWARDCPNLSNVLPTYGSESGVVLGDGNRGASGECYKCHKSGHWARDCPGQSNGQGSVSGVVSGSGNNNGAAGECYKCHQMGHWARDCPGQSNGQGPENGGQGRYGNASKQYFGGY